MFWLVWQVVAFALLPAVFSLFQSISVFNFQFSAGFGFWVCWLLVVGNQSMLVVEVVVGVGVLLFAICCLLVVVCWFLGCWYVGCWLLFNVGCWLLVLVFVRFTFHILSQLIVAWFN